MKLPSKPLVIIGYILLLAYIPIEPASASPSLRGDGRIILFNYHNNEVLEIPFRTARGYDQKALLLINKVMRCRGTNEVAPISPQLIDLLDAIQDHFGAETVEIISGYRSPTFNDYLMVNGRGAASESLHTKGMAADIHIDEVNEKALWDYAKSLGVGGAGYYPRHNFVHVDVGPVRSWREADPKSRILTGVELSPNGAWSVITDKNIYKPGEAISLTVTNELHEKAIITKNIWYGRFRKGKWSEHQTIEKSRVTKRVSPGASFTWKVKPGDLPYGKYRIVVFTSTDLDIPPVYSNEFYVKKQ